MSLFDYRGTKDGQSTSARVYAEILDRLITQSTMKAKGFTSLEMTVRGPSPRDLPAA